MTAYALLFTMAAIGVSETVYLIRTRHEEDGQVICPVGGGCHAVLQSRFNMLFGIHNDVLGLLFYLATALLLALIVIGEGPTHDFARAVALLIFGAAGMSLYFTFLQWRVIKQWCFWCLMSACTVFLMLVTVLVEFRGTVDRLFTFLT